MRVLVLGSGGRENALYSAISKSPMIDMIYGLPGNGGFPINASLNDLDSASSINPVEDFDKINKIVEKYNIQLIVVGPEVPLALGIKDHFLKHRPDLLVFGPDQKSSQLESSKSYAVEYMKKNSIPTAKSITVNSLEDALEKIKNFSLPVVIKADGLAAGKGVSIHDNFEEAEEKLKAIFQNKIFGAAGDKVILQSYMEGTEASLFAICNGKQAIYFPGARDYKPAFDGDQGPNTGGMGSFAPSDTLSAEQIAFIHKNITEPVLRDFSYTGLLYIGLMVHSKEKDGISVVEFNCRFGDPETQAILPLIESDILSYLLWSCGHTEVVPMIKAEGFYHFTL